MLATITSGLVGVSLQSMFHTSCREAGVITCVLLLEGRPPKICEGEKYVRNSVWFLTAFDFDREYLWNDSRYPKSKINVIVSDSSAFYEKSPVKFGPQTKVLLANIEPPKWIFFGGETTFRPLGGASPSNFHTH